MNQAPHLQLRLYIAGGGPNSTLAVANLRAFCEEYFPERHEIEIVDVFQDQRRALDDGVLLTPLLVKIAPGPVRKITGNLSARDSLHHVVDLPNPTL